MHRNIFGKPRRKRTKTAKQAKASRTVEMLDALGEEHQLPGGYSEYSQFCEDGLRQLVLDGHISEAGLLQLQANIEGASSLGITRHSPKAKGAEA